MSNTLIETADRLANSFWDRKPVSINGTEYIVTQYDSDFNEVPGENSAALKLISPIGVGTYELTITYRQLASRFELKTAADSTSAMPALERFVQAMNTSAEKSMAAPKT